MGPRPGPTFSIEREDNDGNYEPSNCRWASRIEQNNNSRNCHLITWRGETKNIAAWSHALGLSERTLRVRISNGWSYEEALSTPTDDAMLTRAKRSETTLITHDGVTQTVSYWARVTGLNRTTIRHRIANGWSVADALGARPDRTRSLAANASNTRKAR